jgi:peroxiredoxin
MVNSVKKRPSRPHLHLGNYRQFWIGLQLPYNYSAMKWRSLEESTQDLDLRPLREIFAERKALIEKYVPAEVRAVHARVVNELKADKIAAGILSTGNKSSSFELKDHSGRPISSAELLCKGRLIVCFIRGRWCPFCVGQMEAMNLAFPKIESAGASMVAISPQTVQQSFFMHDQHKLRFPLLSDTGNEVARQFGLVYPVPGYQQEIYKKAFINLPFANGVPAWELPIPATFVIDSDGTIIKSWADEDYTNRPEPAEILQALTSFSNQSVGKHPVI